MVKRYEFYDRNDDAARAHVESDGDYVTYADYAELQAKADAMAAALDFYAYEYNDSERYARAALAQHGKDQTK